MQLHPRDMKRGDTFYECFYGKCLKMTVFSPIVFENNQWRWTALSENGSQIEYVVTQGMEHYGPSLYSEPAYVRIE